MRRREMVVAAEDVGDAVEEVARPSRSRWRPTLTVFRSGVTAFQRLVDGSFPDPEALPQSVFIGERDALRQTKPARGINNRIKIVEDTGARTAGGEMRAHLGLHLFTELAVVELAEQL